MSAAQDNGGASGKYGAIVGSGRFPLIWLEAAADHHRDGRDGITAVALTDEGFANLEGKVEVVRASLGQAGKVVKTLRRAGAVNVTLMGKVEKAELLKGLKLDAGGVKLLASARDYNDVTLLNSVIAFIEGNGLPVLPQDQWLGHLLVEPLCYTKRKPGKDVKEDIEYGMAMARAVARLGIGQTVVVRKKAVLAVEAIEGTDAAIARGGELAMGKGGAVAKAIKPGQDRRFDLPTVGLSTVRNMAAAGLQNLALEAGSTFLIERADVIRFANDNGIVIVGMESEEQ